MNPVSGPGLLARRRLMVGTLFGSVLATLAACGGGGGDGAAPSPAAPTPPSPPAPPPPAPPPSGPGPAPSAPKSTKRGIAYDLASAADMAALAPGVSWWYGWGSKPNGNTPADPVAAYGMDFVPMLWN